MKTKINNVADIQHFLFENHKVICDKNNVLIKSLHVRRTNEYEKHYFKIINGEFTSREIINLCSKNKDGQITYLKNGVIEVKIYNDRNTTQS